MYTYRDLPKHISFYKTNKKCFKQSKKLFMGKHNTAQSLITIIKERSPWSHVYIMTQININIVDCLCIRILQYEYIIYI